MSEGKIIFGRGVSESSLKANSSIYFKQGGIYNDCNVKLANPYHPISVKRYFLSPITTFSGMRKLLAV
jgi:hypothetical protein